MGLQVGLQDNSKRVGWPYNHKSIKQNIDNNEFVRKIRNKLMKERLRKHLKK